MTDRLPFEASNIRKPEPPKPAHREAARYGQFTPDRPLTVSAACELIRRVLADRTPSPLKVVGEVSNFAARGHWYFSLKDEQSILPAVMWSSAANRVAFEPRNGQEVVATGRLDFYGPQGRLQMYVDRLDPVGEGTLEIAFRRLCDELRGLGYFEDSTKKPIPPFVSHLAVVTSRDGAALADVIRTARQRWGGIRISVVNVKVQGREAAGVVAAAVDSLSIHHRTLGIDAILVTRGGGSLEDLWAFNERIVADAIHRCAAPVIAAIGHETDTTIAELTADLRCSTPSQAAARLTIDSAAEHHRLAQWTARLTSALRRRSELARAALIAVERHEVFRRPVDRLRLLRAELQRRAAELNRVTTRLVDSESRRLAELNRRLTRLEPRTHWAVSRRRLEDAARRLHAAGGIL